MQIEYFGHSCFLITDSSGVRILTDPYTGVGYELPKGISADIVTVSHGHFDHNYIKGVSGEVSVISAIGKTEEKGVVFEGISTAHDPVGGALRGKNTVYKITVDGMTVCHLGDIGEKCSVDIAERIGKVDVLLVPIGGNYTIDANAAWEYVRMIAPSVVIPMHFRPSDGTIDITDEREFLRGVPYVTCKEAYTPEKENGGTRVVFMLKKEKL